MVEVLNRVTMQVFVRGYCTMIAAPVQCDVDGIPKGSHYVSLPPIKVRLEVFSYTVTVDPSYRTGMDLTDQWAIIEPLFEEKRRPDGRGRPWCGARAVLNGVPWRKLLNARGRPRFAQRITFSSECIVKRTDGR